ncbi:MAG: lipopolysaccharide biosynthesis protein [Gemmataceae bacterium]|nr:lipopolysaccharide biosynthesis protein [Gemmataceae bacterium]
MASDSLRQRAVRGGAIFLAVRLCVQLFQWSVTLSVARWLLPDDYSVMTVGAMFVGFADILADAGIGKAIVFKKEIDDDDLAQGFSVGLALSTLMYAGIFVLAPFLGQHAHSTNPDLNISSFCVFLRVLALVLFLVPLRSIGNAILERDFRLGRQSLAQLGGALMQAATVLILAWLGYGYWALASGVLISRTLEAVFVAVAAQWRPRLALPSARSWQLLRFGMHISLATLFWMTYSNADYAVAFALFPSAVLGYYALAFEMMAMPVQKFSVTINQVMFAYFSRHQDDRELLRDWYLRLAALMTALAAPVLVGLALVASDALPLLLTEKWRPAVLPFQILCPVGVLMIVGSSLAQMISARGRPDILVRYNFVCAIVYPLAFSYAASEFGFLGLCLVWPILYPTLFFSLIHLTRHITGITIPGLLHSQRVVLTGLAFMVTTVLIAQNFLQHDPRPWLRLIVAIAVGALSYAAFMLTLAKQTLLVDLRKLWTDLRGRKAPPPALS